MEFIRYKNIEDFMKDNFELILEKEWLNCLMVGNCLEGQKIGTEGWLLAKVTQNEKTELIMLYRKPWKLIMYSPTNNTSEELFKFAAEEVYKIDNNLLGVNGEVKIANKFAKYYCEVAKKQYSLIRPMKILLLEKLRTMELQQDLKFRTATLEDKQQLIQYIKEFENEALNQKISNEDVNNKFNLYFEKGYYVLEKDGKVVSQATFARNLLKGKCISGVYTPKEERGKGYAYTLVYTLSKKCLDEGAEYCVLYTDANYPISNHIYEKIGYVPKTECEELEFYE